MDNIAFSLDTATRSISQSPEKENEKHEECTLVADSHTLETPTKIYFTPEKSKEVCGAEGTSCSLTKKRDFCRLNVNEELKKTLESHGIPRQNADSFLLGLLKNREFKNLVMTTNLNEDYSSDEDASTPAVPMTRAKLREAMKNSPFKMPSDGKTKKAIPKFTEIPLPDDDDDEEYNPIETSFSSDTRERYLMNDDIENKIDKDCDKKLVVCEIETDSTPTEIEEPTKGEWDDIISKRTRSKHSLQSTSINMLEAAFDPPDATSDMYDTSVVDYDWQKWLSDLMKDGEGENNADEEDNPEEDPDFDFTPGLDKPDKEDMRDDHSVQVSKKELYGLLDEIENMQKNDWPPMTLIAVPSTDDSFQSLSPPKQMKSKSIKRKRSHERAVQPEITHLQMSHSQIELLTQQLQQHVQLLAQVNHLCRNNADFNDCVAESKELLLELQQVGLTQMNSLSIESSHTIPWSLKEAIALTEINTPPSEPSIRLFGREVNRGQESLPEAAAKIIANSKVFMYRELLPLSAPSLKNSSQKVPFRPAEDCLLALGLAEMKGMENIFELISQYMLPTKTDKQIQVRIRNVLYCRNLKDTVNPIRNYHVCQTLPARCTNTKFVYEHSAEKPIDMKGTLPCWVLAMKPIDISEESSDDSLSDLGPSQVQSTAYNNPAGRRLIEDQQTLNSPHKAVMVPCSIIKAVSAINTPMHRSIQSVSATLPTVAPIPCRSSSSVPSLATVVTPTSISTNPITTAKIQTIPKYGRRRSAGKSIKRLAECERSAKISLSSSSSSEEETELEAKKWIFPTKNDIIHSEMEEEPPAESHEEEQCDLEGHSERKPTEAISSLSMSRPSCVRREDPKFLPTGGYLQKVHPKLSGRKGRKSSRDLRRARSTDKVVKCLEEDTIVQLDPRRIEKEKLFATGFLERVEKALKNHPAVYKKFLETLIKYSDCTKSPVDLYTELSTLLHDWPDLVQGFAPFLMPEQAQECGLNMEQEVYARARKFLRQLEIQFSNNPDHMEKVLNVFHNVAETAIYRDEEMMKSILILLNGYPYLQGEFLTFADRHPPKALFDKDDFTEEMMKNPTLSQYEQVTLPLAAAESDIIPPNESSIKRPRKRKISLGSREEGDSPAKVVSLMKNTEDICPENVNSDADDEEAVSSDFGSEDAMMEDMVEDRDINIPFTSVPPDIAAISEDALSSSPFKRITEEEAALEHPDLLRPQTPTGIKRDSTQSFTLTASPLPRPKSCSNELPILPVTPGKMLLPKRRGQSISVGPPETDGGIYVTNTAPTTVLDEKATDVTPAIQDNAPLLTEEAPHPISVDPPQTDGGISFTNTAPTPVSDEKATDVTPAILDNAPPLTEEAPHPISVDPPQTDGGISFTNMAPTPVADEKATNVTPAIQDNASPLTEEAPHPISMGPAQTDGGISFTNTAPTPVADEIEKAPDGTLAIQDNSSSPTKKGTRVQSLVQDVAPPLTEEAPHTVENTHLVTEGVLTTAGSPSAVEKMVTFSSEERVQPDKAVSATEDSELHVRPQTGNAAFTGQDDSEPILPSGLHQINDITWTRQADELILTFCQKGITQSVLAEVAEKLGRTLVQVESRLGELLCLFNDGETDNAVGQESEEDSDIFSDSSSA